MPEHEHERRDATARPRDASAVPAAPLAAQALQRQVGNRAFGRALSRMESTQAVEALEQSLGAGVLGAERQVVDTMTAFSADTAGFDKVAKDFETKVKTPLPPELGRVPGAADRIPGGWYPGISE